MAPVKALEQRDSVTYQTYLTQGKRQISGSSLTFSPKENGITLLPFYGKDVYSLHTMTQMICEAQSQGYEVLGAIGGDMSADDLSGAPMGPLIQNGRVICSEAGPPADSGIWRTFGLKRDGTVRTGRLEMEKALYLANGTGSPTQLTFHTFNRTLPDAGMGVFTADAGTVSLGQECNAVLLRVEQGSFLLGEQVVCRVERAAATQRKLAAPKGGVLLAASKSTQNQALTAQLYGLRAGQRVDIRLSAEGWEDVVQAISGPHLALKDGEPAEETGAPVPYAKTNLLAADGEGVLTLATACVPKSLLQKELTVQESAELLKSMGCVNGLMLGGCASSRLAYWNDLTSPQEPEQPIGTCLLVVKGKPIPDMTHAPPFTPAPPEDKTSSPAPQPSPSSGAKASSSKASRASSSKTSSRPKTQTGNVSSLPETEIEERALPADGRVPAQELRPILGKARGVRYTAAGEPRYSWLLWGRDLQAVPEDGLNLLVERGGPDEAAIRALSPDALCFALARQEPLAGRAVLAVDVSSRFAEGEALYAYGWRDGTAYLLAKELTVTGGTARFYVTSFDSVFLTNRPVPGAEEESAAAAQPLGEAKGALPGAGVVIPLFVLLSAAAGLCAYVVQKRTPSPEEKAADMEEKGGS